MLETNKNAENKINPIAIVGLSCRFPKAENLQEFWKMLENGIDAVEKIPASRWDIDEYYDADKSAADKTHQRHAAMLDNIDKFDPFFFNISPAEAAEMTPSQKLMMELTWECLESGNIPYQQIAGKKVGVYVGNIWSDFEHLRKHKNAVVTSHSAMGQSANIIANRISYFYGFSGPSLVVDTGCSSSLVALHLACQSLWDGSTSYGLVGGVNHTLDPDQNILLSKFGGLSAKGSCSTFDIAADGFVRGEGGGIILLKRLEDAERDGDKIFALIKGSAMNNNGFNVNLPATSTNGQLDVLQSAYERSDIAPADVHYVEAHGTGTKLGDPTESRALGQFFSTNRTRPLHVGSVKTNIGHLEGAAGIAGLIKVVLAMNKRKLPKNLHFKTPNPDIDFENLKLKVQDSLSDWPAKPGEPLRAGVNSFGWGGTNAHTILEEYVPKECNVNIGDHQHGCYLLPLSAKSEGALFQSIYNYLHYYRTQINGVAHQFENACKLAATTKSSFEFRKLFKANSKENMIESISSFLSDHKEWTASTPLHAVNDKVVFIFPGQGSQWIGMGKALFQYEPVFKETIIACDKEWNKYTDWSLIDQLHAAEGESRLDEIDVIQPMLSAVQIALGKLWMSIGLKPDSVVGHSMGEVAAAYISGSISINEAAQIICNRSKLMKTMSGKGGAMAVTELTLEQAERVVKRYPELSIAVNNSPKSTVLAGAEQAIEEIIAELDKQGRFTRRVKVDVASHSKQMDPIKEELGNSLQLNPKHQDITLYSTVRNQIVEGEDLTSEYWVDNLRHGVQFAAVMDKLVEDGHKVFIEVSPHPVLITSINECLDANNCKAVVTSTLHRDKEELCELYDNVSTLYENGVSINWNQFYKNVNTYHTFLPSYPFQREEYKLNERLSLDKNKSGHPWIGREIKLANLPEIHFWEAHINLNQFPYIKDHQVNNITVLPGTAYVEMILAALNELSGSQHCEIVNLSFKKAITFEDNESIKVQLKLHEEDDGLSGFKFYQQNQDKWLLTAEGEYHFKDEVHSYNVSPFKTLAGDIISGEDYYKQLESIGLNYGPYFQGISQLTIDQNDIKANVKIDSKISGNINKYHFHPAVLDSCFQALFVPALNGEDSNYRTTYLTRVGRLEVFGNIPKNSDLQVNIKIKAKQENEHFTDLLADLVIYDEQGNPLLKVEQVGAKIMSVSDYHQADNEWFHQVQWLKTEINKKSASAGLKNYLLISNSYIAVQQLVSKLSKQGHTVSVLINKLESPNSENVKIYKTNYDDLASVQQTLREINLNSQDDVIFFFTKELHHDKLQLKTASAYYLVNVMQAINALKLKRYPKLNVVTNGSKPIENTMINIEHGPLNGLARVIANELPQYETLQIDLSYLPNNSELEIFTQLLSSRLSKEKEIAIRNKDVYVSRLNKVKPDIFGIQNKTFSPVGSYLVTGYNGIAFRLVEWMFAKGARNFILLSRSGNTDEYTSSKIQEFQKGGASFEIIPCDVSDYFGLKQVFEDQEFSINLKGIIHAAGLIQATPINELTSDNYSNILAPKVKGGWNLHLLSKEYDLDTFLLFSSASSMIGLSGQGSYVAANAFLDSLAQYRHSLGLTATAVNWGVMTDAGMVANAEEMAKYAKAEGFIPTTMKEAVDALDHIIFQQPVNIGIFKISPDQTADFFPSLGASNYFGNLLLKEEKSNENQSLLQTLELLPNKEEKQLALENHVKLLTAKIIKSTPGKLNSEMRFKNLGIDSIMAVQLRNKLEKDLSLKLSVTNIWEYPTIGEYSSFLMGRLVNSEEGDLLTTPKRNGKVVQSLVIPKPNPEASFRMICFHDAGGSSSLYDMWETMLDADIELIILELPGRGKQLSAKPFQDIKFATNKILKDLKNHLDKPYFLFGHSMGGLIAFELLRLIRTNNLRQPQQLFISSTPQLASYERAHLDPRLDNQQLMDSFPHLKPENTPDPELRKVLITLLRNDLALIDSFKYEFQPPFDLPIIAIHGVDDNTVSHGQIENWKNETTTTFKLIQRKGGHHYLRNDREFITHLINSEIDKTILINK
ncbi:type I polyketide synthase [Fulvivirga ligni]|uniref:type I polyketide synthase n=1 Tax=Fulvivirga ligni TaxID=2904246 RepID=UPI001F2FC28F|nr:type I polyketide synthase [Fulvivirga ligni]UII23300.1 SDR family NAD(P)-dependent oxidoreductase [Fulvivirga ligni]